jgi:uncharacterized protein YciI
MQYVFIISITYKKHREELDVHMEDHMAYVRRQYAKGHFLASGRKIPRTGGIILSNVNTRAQLDEIIQQDPFYQHQLVDFEVIEFSITNTCSELELLKTM